MADIIIENIVTSTHLKTELNIQQLANKIQDSKYDPSTFPGLVLPFNNPMSGFNRGVGQKIIGPGLNESKDSTIEVNKNINLRKYGPRGQGTRPLG